MVSDAMLFVDVASVANVEFLTCSTTEVDSLRRCMLGFVVAMNRDLNTLWQTNLLPQWMDIWIGVWGLWKKV